MTQEFTALSLGIALGGGFGFFGGGPVWSLATVFYLTRLHKKEIEQIKEQAAVEAKRQLEQGLKQGLAEGKDSIETYTDFRVKGFFGRSLRYIVVVYDRREKRIRHLSGHIEDHELFSNIPPEVKDAIIAGGKKVISIAAAA